jgi:NIMA (never in mitosis gene a)-related kinase 1/4/5
MLSNTRSRAQTTKGTTAYLSPEIIKEESYSFKTDIWSLGVLLYEITALQYPFYDENVNQLYSLVLNASYPPLPPKYSD